MAGAGSQNQNFLDGEARTVAIKSSLGGLYVRVGGFALVPEGLILKS